ncbi:hypothetical protein HGRIS_005439 [Hohenbuehelia grisea]|uniref:Uncharacterized protein n=1 Tax=Hohenbuehelia grisea TaxID=104357 RepID=A0ABR3JYL7_9AGAR
MPPHRSASESAISRPRYTPYTATHARYLKAQQREAANLTTCDYKSNFPVLKSFPYPLDHNGAPVEPSNFKEHLDGHDMPFPRCFCDYTCRIIGCRTGEHKGKWAIACGQGSACNFWVVIDNVLGSCSGNIKYHQYPRHGKGTKLIEEHFTECPPPTAKRYADSPNTFPAHGSPTSSASSSGRGPFYGVDYKSEKQAFQRWDSVSAPVHRMPSPTSSSTTPSSTTPSSSQASPVHAAARGPETTSVSSSSAPSSLAPLSLLPPMRPSFQVPPNIFWPSSFSRPADYRTSVSARHSARAVVVRV